MPYLSTCGRRQEWFPGGAVSGLDLALARRSASIKAGSGSWEGGHLPSFSSAGARGASAGAPPSAASEARPALHADALPPACEVSQGLCHQHRGRRSSYVAAHIPFAGMRRLQGHADVPCFRSTPDTTHSCS